MVEESQLESVINASAEHGCRKLPNCTPVTFQVNPADLVKVCNQLLTNPTTYMDMLVSITAVDNGAEKMTFDVLYHLNSLVLGQQISLRVNIPRALPEVDSVTSVWRSANWLERETFDLFGINFKNHPDLRRILLPADWKDFPLRKDYKHEEEYRGIRIEY